MTCLKYARTNYIPICDGITGEIGNLEVYETHIDESCDIDTLALNLTWEESIDENIGRVGNIL